ncbi:phage tail protein [Vibrio parahaemolyticus]|nr:phage tail protein [Vibrio parahaemolyticus]
MQQTIKGQADLIFSGLDSEYQNWEPHYKEIAKFLQPRRQRFNTSDTNHKSSINTAIVDPSATLAMRVAMGGMYSGITNPTTQWIRLTVSDKDLSKSYAVRSYLDQCSQLIMYMLAKTNFYNIAPTAFIDILSYSTASVGIEKDEKTVLRFYPSPVGSYRLANGPRLNVNTHGKKRMWTVAQMVERFGIDNVSDAVKHSYNSQNYQNKFEVRHLVFDNPDYIPTAFSSTSKKYCSLWYEPIEGSDKILHRGGFDDFPFLTPRWEVLGADSYGSFGPGMLALGSIKGLQVDQRNKHTANALQIKPPMVGPTSLKNNGASLVPGGLTFVDGVQGVQGFVPAYQTNFSTQEVLLSISDTRQIIDQAFFKDLFLAIIDVNKSGVTATEILQRKEEKMLMLGPVLSRFDEEFLDPTVSLAYSEMDRRGMLPEVPEELIGKELNIEYMGMLHQAQKAIGVSSIERTLGFIGNLAGIAPQVMDKINIDASVDIYTDITGTTPEILNDDQTVQQIRDQRAQAQQSEKLAAMAQPAQQGAQAAELLSKVDVTGPNGLTNMMGI